VNLANTMVQAGQLDEAISEYTQVVPLLERTVGPSHPWMFNALNGLGMAYLERKNPAGAAAALERALKVHGEKRAEDSARAMASYRLAQALWALRRDRPRALRLAEEARATLRAAHSEEHAEVERWLLQARAAP
jgi:tetratricopeptide (TPR) repeat protein